jgi:hypothetical protein
MGGSDTGQGVDARRLSPICASSLQTSTAVRVAFFVPALSYLTFVLSNGVVLVAAYWHEGHARAGA